MQYSYSRITRRIYSNFLQKQKASQRMLFTRKEKMKKLSIKNYLVVISMFIMLQYQSDNSLNKMCKCF